jgi:hypothetical protein
VNFCMSEIQVPSVSLEHDIANSSSNFELSHAKSEFRAETAYRMVLPVKYEGAQF